MFFRRSIFQIAMTFMVIQQWMQKKRYILSVKKNLC